MSGQAGSERAEAVDSFPLCKEAVAYCPILRCALTAFGLGGKPGVSRFCSLRSQSCRHTVLKGKAKRRGVLVQSVFPASPPGHCSNCRKVEPLIRAPPPPFLYLAPFAHPSSLCLRACSGVVVYQAGFWQTVGRTPQDVGWIKCEDFAWCQGETFK